MQVGLMITNGGTHSAEKWAAVSAGQIIQIATDASGLQAIDGRKLELKILDILEAAHETVKVEEATQIEQVGNQHINTEVDLQAKVADTVSKIVAASQGTVFADHFAKPEVQAYVGQVVGSHFATSIHCERSWHADQNTHCPHCQEFKANR